MKKGERVGAIHFASSKEGIISLYGYGVYQGDQKCTDPTVKFFGRSLANIDVLNPKIELDNGEVVWGCECWWGPEQEVKDMESKFKTVKFILPSEARKESE